MYNILFKYICTHMRMRFIKISHTYFNIFMKMYIETRIILHIYIINILDPFC